MKYYVILCFILLLLCSCSGKDKLVTDTTPPLKPVLIPHLGDLGDDPYEYNGQVIYFFNEDHNGIDAVPDGNWIRVSWEHLLDTDLDYVRIFRFDEFNDVPALIDSISSNNDFYVDSRNSITTHRRYSYFIEAVDNSGNFTRSDTVSYKLLSKQILISPANDATVNPNNIKFEWQKSGFVSKFRLLLFDSNYNYIWKYDLDVSFEGDFFEAYGPSNLSQLNPGEFIYWRVDAFDYDSELDFFIGSESNERILYLTNP